ncbi:MAG: GntR family transcriptional regulator [Desulfobacterales bacterium]|jgi:DNA-binding GntR family transcriptional regulator
MQIFKPVEKDEGSLTEQVYQNLRHGIITGAVGGGTRLVETVLAAEMNVSRTPVREALHKLALEGFLYAIPRAGYIVEETSETDIKDLFTTRTAIEKIAVKWAIEKITPEELARLEMNLQKTDEILKSGATESMGDLDAEFHEIIYRAARSKTLYKISQTLSDHTLRFRLACIHVPELARRAKQGHMKIFQAIQVKDSTMAEKMVEDHLDTVTIDILNHLEKMRQDAFVGDISGF